MTEKLGRSSSFPSAFFVVKTQGKSGIARFFAAGKIYFAVPEKNLCKGLTNSCRGDIINIVGILCVLQAKNGR